MTQEDKELLLKDLCARLPYETKCAVFHNETIWKDDETVFYVAGANIITFEGYERNECYMYWQIKPYLRLLSSMTEKERMKIASMAGFGNLTKSTQIIECCTPIIDYCYSRYLDIHHLIEKGLALEAPEGMYKIE